MPPKGGKGDDWLDVRPRRRKALRQGGRGQDWKLEDKRFSERFGISKRQSGIRDSREGFVESDVDFYQDGYSDRCWEESEIDWRRREDRRRAGVSFRRDAGTARVFRAPARRVRGLEPAMVNAAIPANSGSAPGPRFRRFVTFYFTHFPPHLSNIFYEKALRFAVC